MLLLVYMLSSYPFVCLKWSSFVIFHVWSPIILHRVYTALTVYNLRIAHNDYWPDFCTIANVFHPCAFQRRLVVCFLLLCSFFWTCFFWSCSHWRYPPIDGNNWGAEHFNECARSSWIRVSCLTGALLYILKDGGATIVGNSQWKHGKVQLERAVFWSHE